MGRGGANLLWSSGITCASHCPLWGNSALNPEEEYKRFIPFITASIIWLHWVMRMSTNVNNNVHFSPITCQGYRDKPYGQLVLVSLMHYCTSTPSLSTSWSRTTLQRAQGSGKSQLKASFPLRVFQRLSLPNLATRQCHWRDNRYPRGSSTPVLSY